MAGGPQKRKLAAARDLLQDVWASDYVPRERNDIISLAHAVQKRVRGINLSLVWGSNLRYEMVVKPLTEGKANYFGRGATSNTQAHLEEVMSSVNPLCVRLMPPSSPLRIHPDIKDMVELDSTCLTANSLLALLYALKKPFYVKSASLGMCCVESLQIINGVYMGPICNALAYELEKEGLGATLTLAAEAIGCDKEGRRVYGHQWARLELTTAAGARHVAFMDCTAAQFGCCSSSSGIEFWLEGAAKGERYKSSDSITLFDLQRGNVLPPPNGRILNPCHALDQHLFLQTMAPALEGRSAAEGERWIIPKWNVRPILQALAF